MNLFQIFYNLGHYCAEISILVRKNKDIQRGACWLSARKLYDEITLLSGYRNPKPENFDRLCSYLTDISDYAISSNNKRIKNLCNYCFLFIDDIKEELLKKKDTIDFPLCGISQAIFVDNIADEKIDL